VRKTVSRSSIPPRQTKDKSGANSTESEVIREGSRALGARDAALEDWLRTEGVARYDAYHDGRSRGRTADEVLSRVRAHHIEQTKRRIERVFRYLATTPMRIFPRSTNGAGRSFESGDDDD
jgi:Arc/MetJ-type ribon-helix-helix transcriptional regulator